MSLLLFLILPTAISGQWGIRQGAPQMMEQFPQGGYMSGYPQMPQGQTNFGMGMNNAQPFGDNSRLGSPVIRPSAMGYGYPGQMSQFPPMSSSPMASYPFPGAGGIPSMSMVMQGYPIQSQGLNPMNIPRPISSFGQFQDDSVNRDIEKPTSSLQPTRIIPPFMRTASPQQLDQFYSIVQNTLWSPSEKQQKIEEFVRSMDMNTQNLFASYTRATQSESEIKRQKVHKLVDEMTPEAQIQFQKVSAAMTNPTLNETERLQKIQDIYSKIPDTIKKEFDEKLTNL